MYPTPEKPAFGSFVWSQVEALKKAGLDIALLVLQGRIRKFIYPKGVVQLRRRLANDNIDLVHAHYSYAGMVARTQWKVPVIVTYHGDDLLGTVNPVGETTRFSKLGVAAGKILGKMADAVIVQNREMVSKLKTKNNVYILPHEVNLELFRPMEKHQAREILSLDQDRKYLLFAADPRISVKRFSLAKEAVDYLKRQDANIELLTVYKETQRNLVNYMNACDALIFPSFQEGSPNIIKQAMACNLPIVATDVGDVRAVIGKTKGCYVCRPDVSSFAEKLSKVLRWGQRTQGRDQIRCYAPHIVSRKLIQIYTDTLKKHRSHQVYHFHGIY
jgi:glycosyltransferase involved in cell wall biosynthesis